MVPDSKRINMPGEYETFLMLPLQTKILTAKYNKNDGLISADNMDIFRNTQLKTYYRPHPDILY